MTKKNTYTIEEIQRIYDSCTTFDEVEAATQSIHYLLRNGQQQRSPAMQEIALRALRKFM